MAKPIAHNPQRVALKSSGYFGPPTGTKDIFENGIHDVKTYAYVDVQIQPPLLVKTIIDNGEYSASQENVYGYSKVIVDVQLPSAEEVAY